MEFEQKAELQQQLQQREGALFFSYSLFWND
jgi:hypothetical protein